MTLDKLACGSYVVRTDPGEPGYGTPRVSITDAEGALLASLVKGMHVFEIGTGLGVSTRWLASTAKSVTSLDVDPWVQEMVWPTLADLKNVTLIGDKPTGGTSDVAFIDGHHSPNAVWADIALAKKRKPKMLVFHDAHSPTVVRGIELAEIGAMTIHDTTHGIGVVTL